MPTQAFPVRQFMTDTSLIDLHGEGFARSRNAEATQRTPAVESWFGGDSGSRRSPRSFENQVLLLL
jgi:hypothetical protein